MKEKKLRRHKLVATALFLFMVVLCISMVVVQKKTPDLVFVGYVKAFSEAAMVGALADWFAVTALFNKPLGIPIPHTNLIENRKKDIGDNLGNFVVDNFLKPENVRPYIESINASAFVSEWFSKEKNISYLISEIEIKLKEIIQNTDDEKIILFIARKSKDLLEELRVNTLTSNVLEYLLKEKEHQKLFDILFQKIEFYIWENKDFIRKRISEESSFFIPNFVDKILAEKITSGLADYMNEIAKNKEHSVRKEIENQLYIFAYDLKESPHWEEKLESLKNNLLQSENVQKYAKNVWLYAKENIEKDLSQSIENSFFKKYFKRIISDFTKQLKTDKQMQNRLDTWVQKTAYQFVIKNRNEVGELISRTVGNWKGRELSQKLELEVGKDLQFIRINGTLVGGLVGLFIYFITQLF